MNSLFFFCLHKVIASTVVTHAASNYFVFCVGFNHNQVYFKCFFQKDKFGYQFCIFAHFCGVFHHPIQPYNMAFYEVGF